MTMMGQWLTKRWISIAVIIGAAGGCGGGTSGAGGLAGRGAAGANGAGNPAMPDSTPAGGGASGNEPVIAKAWVPDAPSGTIALGLDLVHASSLPTTVKVEVRGADGSYRPAHMFGSVGWLPSSPQGTVATAVWDSVRDIGFRTPQAATLRLTPMDANGVRQIGRAHV